MLGILKKTVYLGVQSIVLMTIFLYFGLKGTTGCPFEVLGPAVFPGCILCVEIHTWDSFCCPHFPRSRGNALGNMLIDLAPLTSTVLPHSWLEPQCFSDKTNSPGILYGEKMGNSKCPMRGRVYCLKSGAEVGFPHLEK